MSPLILKFLFQIPRVTCPTLKTFPLHSLKIEILFNFKICDECCFSVCDTQIYFLLNSLCPNITSRHRRNFEREKKRRQSKTDEFACKSRWTSIKSTYQVTSSLCRWWRRYWFLCKCRWIRNPLYRDWSYFYELLVGFLVNFHQKMPKKILQAFLIVKKF